VAKRGNIECEATAQGGVVLNATDVLSNEHRAIELVLTYMEISADRIAAGRSMDTQTLEKCLEFVQVFADRCHHGKEEDVLFPLLEARGIPREGGPIGAMLSDHDAGRRFIAAARENLERFKAGDDSARQPLAEALRGYVSLLRNHIAKEDNVLFAMAHNVLTPEDNEQLIREFDCIEEEKIGPGVHEEYHKWLDELAEKLKAT